MKAIVWSGLILNNMISIFFQAMCTYGGVQLSWCSLVEYKGFVRHTSDAVELMDLCFVTSSRHNRIGGNCDLSALLYVPSYNVFDHSRVC